MMDLCEYQMRARSTAIYLDIKDSRMMYPALGLIGECGEVAKKIKKLIRDDGGDMTEERKCAIAKELGDCCWYLANICCDTNHDLIMMHDMRRASTVHQVRGLSLPQLVFQMNRHATAVATMLEDWYYKHDSRLNERDQYTELPGHLTHIITCINEIARRCDFTLEDICIINIKKLSTRKEKGTLKGEGDSR